MSQNQKFVIANWKMKLGISESIHLAKAIKKIKSNVEVVVCPSFASVVEVRNILKGSKVKVGGQDCFWESEGAYTGEVSASQLREAGCDYVIIGHSERRKYLQETDEMIHNKIKTALSASLTPIICVGESFEQRSEGATDYVLINQVTKAIEGVDLGSDKKIIIAYEPVWVIGSGQAISPDEAEHAHQVIRQSLFDIFSPGLVKNNFSIIYGGSITSQNVGEFIALENTSGVLVGGASLKSDEFIAIIKNTQNTY